jgi:O-antigen/teichoic acid export membrane protein
MKFSVHGLVAFGQLLLIRGTGMISLFLVNVIIARSFGPATQGLFQIGLSWVIVAATFFRLGQDQLLLRLAAECKSQDDIAQIDRKMNAGLVLALFSLAIGTCVAVLLIQFNLQKAEGENSVEFLSIMVLAILPTGILMIVTETMRGWQSINKAMTWQGSVPQTLVMAFLLVAVFATPILSSLWIAAIYVAVFSGAALCAWQVWRSMIRCAPTFPGWSDILLALTQGRYFWSYSILTAIVAWVDVILLGSVDTPETVGHYAAVIRTGAVLGTFVQIVSSGAVAKLALLYAKGDYDGFANLFRNFFKFFAIGAMPLTIFLFAFSEEIMSIWGNGFVYEKQLVLVYGGFQILNFAVCLTGFTVVVLGLERQLAFIQLASLVFKVLFIMVLHRLFGLSGVVWAAGISLLFVNLLTFIAFIRRMQQLGIRHRRLFFV